MEQDAVKIKSANKILLVANPKNEEACLASIGLGLSLRKLGYSAFLATNPENESVQRLAKPLLWQGYELREFIISVDTSEVPLEELRYEQTDDKKRLDIHLKPLVGGLAQDRVGFSYRPVRWEAVGIIGIDNLRELHEIMSQNSLHLFDTPTFYISSKRPFDRLGAWEVINENASSVAEVVVHWLKKFFNYSPTDIEATIFLSSALSGKNDSLNIDLLKDQASTNLLRFAAETIEAGANTKEASRLLLKKSLETEPDRENQENLSQATLVETQTEPQNEQETPIPTAQQVMVHESEKFAWLSLTKDLAKNENMTENKTSPAEMLFNLVVKSKPKLNGGFVICETTTGNPHSEFRCWLTHQNPFLLNQLSELLRAQNKEAYIVFSVKASSLSEAEAKVLKLSKAAFEFS
ncbi:hypothetical protein C4553_01215 [Candidatus Parcubacteria bacterium]|nr:MAG: hypothetical protein C4553_01215 [Candidatus Parcubacteria bacterium]